VRRRLGAFWQIPSPNHFDFRLCGLSSYLAFNPIGVGYECLLQGAGGMGPGAQLHLSREDREAVNARLEALPAEREEDYYTLSTRFEALEIVFEAVRALAESRGYAEMQYTDEDYPLGMSGTLS